MWAENWNVKLLEEEFEKLAFGGVIYYFRVLKRLSNLFSFHIVTNQNGKVLDKGH